ncbi:probable serine hydrolase [Toxorhynchites rutilus septentrionalis]|uniref:probable serine hydrolase n=1 Tax=Toxorhynchites rutilus septentrionalis TaxID=329112 RepID=UPI00247A2B4C|nr:probable serine hydrolase [Toxorhynchites rutilus septentrionalis]
MTNAKHDMSTLDDELRTQDRHPMIKFIDLYNKQHNVSEVQIPLPYGKLAGKWFGPKNVKPILCIHGWLDNCGTFDRLIPLLPEDMSFLAIDLPGHGYSSRLPDGMAYHQMDFVIILLHIMREYGWKTIGIIGHSMGSIVSFIFSALFPEKVEFLIGIDALKPHSYYPKTFMIHASTMVAKFIEADIRNRENSEPPAYTYEEMVEKLHEGTFQSVTRDTCPYLLQRNIKTSKKFPGKYYFDRDNKLKYTNIPGWSDAVNHELAKQVTTPHLVIKALDSPYPGSREGFNGMVTVLKEHNPRFQLEYVKGSHHIHLTDPEKITPMITEFLRKNWVKQPDSVVSKL